MKKKLIYSVAVLCAVFAFGACSLSEEGITPNGEVNERSMEYNPSDNNVAVTVVETESDRTSATGPKITSNAHSNDFPGILFIWKTKHRGDGYLKVHPSVFDEYESFVLTSKEANTYWDFKIQLQEGQQKSTDGCYVFFIPKVYNNKKINMVFLGDYVEKPELPVEPEPTEFVTTVFSGRDFGTPVTSQSGDVFFQDYWNEGIFRSNYAFDAMATAADREPALWAWTYDNSLLSGETGETVTFTYSFEIPGNVITENPQMLFAADNAMAVWVNGIFVGNTSGTYFDGTDISVIDGDAWRYAYIANPKLTIRYFTPGVNEIKIMARNVANPVLYPGLDPYNTDPAQEGYNTTNNPAGVLFALMVKSAIQ